MAELEPIAARRFKTGTTVVAMVADRLVGFVFSLPLDGFMYLANISVLPEMAGRGVGAALLKASAAVADQQELVAVTLATFKDPPWNGAWFRKCGFVPMPPESIGVGLKASLDRHARYVDISTRETLWKQVAVRAEDAIAGDLARQADGARI
jgi:N-acetylglutamate synthase-like GNAT family acetyltransferase